MYIYIRCIHISIYHLFKIHSLGPSAPAVELREAKLVAFCEAKSKPKPGKLGEQRGGVEG